MAPRGIRNNNPGNIEYGRFARTHGAIGSDGRFAKFATPEAGLAAIAALQQSYEGRGLTTVRERINRWAPPSENVTSAYVTAVAGAMGIDPDTPFSITDPVMGPAFISAMVQHENGQQPYATTQIASAQQAALSGATMSAASSARIPPADVSPLGSSVMRRGRTQGTRVIALQQTLAALGYYNGAIDGKFGPQTEEAVKTYQKATNLPVTGKVDLKTLGYMTPTYEQIVANAPLITPADQQRNTIANTLANNPVAREMAGSFGAIPQAPPYNPTQGPPPANPMRAILNAPPAGQMRPPPYNPAQGPPPVNPQMRPGVNVAPIPRMRPDLAPITPVERQNLPPLDAVANAPIPRMRPEIAPLAVSAQGQPTTIPQASVALTPAAGQRVLSQKEREALALELEALAAKSGLGPLAPQPAAPPTGELSPEAERMLTEARAQSALAGIRPYGPEDYGTGMPVTQTAAGPPTYADQRAAFEQAGGVDKLRALALAANAGAIQARGAPVYDMSQVQLEADKERARQQLANALIGVDTQNLPAEAGTGGAVSVPAPQAAGASSSPYDFLGGLPDMANVVDRISSEPSGITLHDLQRSAIQNLYGNANAGSSRPSAGYGWTDISGPLKYDSSSSEGNAGLKALTEALDIAARNRAAISPRSYSSVNDRPAVTAADVQRTSAQNTRGNIAAGPSMPSYGSNDYGSGAPVSAGPVSAPASARPASYGGAATSIADLTGGAGTLSDLAAYGAGLAANAPAGAMVPTAATAAPIPGPGTVIGTLPPAVSAAPAVVQRAPASVRSSSLIGAPSSSRAISGSQFAPYEAAARSSLASYGGTTPTTSSREPSGRHSGVTSTTLGSGNRVSSYTTSSGKTITEVHHSDHTTSSSTVLCTYYKNKGWLPKLMWIAASKDRMSRPNRDVLMLGYHAWAVPAVRWLEGRGPGTKAAERILWPLIRAWAYEAAYRSGYLPRGTIKGKIARAILEPSSWLIGTALMAFRRQIKRAA